MLRVGLTGGIACGKSRVLRRLAARGLRTLDLDAVSREVTAPGSAALVEIREAFGERVLRPDGELDRAALGAIVFSDASARARLDAIVHPRVRAAEVQWAREHAGDPEAVLVTDAALLVEAGAHLRFDRLVVVHCDPAEQLARLRARDGLDEAAARARIEAQMPVGEKRAFAHLEVDTSGSPDDTDRQSDVLADALLDGARRAPSRAVPFARRLGMLAAGPRDGPRGLSPLALLQAIAERGGVEMAALAARLDPPAGGPWYRAATAAAPVQPAVALVPALAAACLGRPGVDGEFLAAAAASLARLTHVEPSARTDACVLALLLLEAARGGTADVNALMPRVLSLAARWGGEPRPGPGPAWRDAALRGAASGLREVDAPRALAAALRAADASAC